MSVSGVREKKAKSLTNGVPRDSEREHLEDGRKCSFYQLLNDGRKSPTIRIADKLLDHSGPNDSQLVFLLLSCIMMLL